MSRVGPKPVQSGDQYPRTEHSGKLAVGASSRVNAFFQDQVAMNANATRQQRNLDPKRVTKKMGSGAHPAAMAATRFFTSKPYNTLVAPRLRGC